LLAEIRLWHKYAHSHKPYSPINSQSDQHTSSCCTHGSHDEQSFWRTSFHRDFLHTLLPYPMWHTWDSLPVKHVSNNLLTPTNKSPDAHQQCGVLCLVTAWTKRRFMGRLTVYGRRRSIRPHQLLQCYCPRINAGQLRTATHRRQLDTATHSRQLGIATFTQREAAGRVYSGSRHSAKLLKEQGNDVCCAHLPSSFLAAATMAFFVTPNSSYSLGAGAEAPKWSTPI
jgi:hypothetical protein